MKALATAAALIAIAAAQPAAASLQFGFVPTGPVVLDTGNITPATISATYPGAFVNIADSAYGIDLFDPVTLSGPFQLITGAIDLTISTAGYDFWFDRAERGPFVFTGAGAGAFAMSYTGPGVQASQSCDQAGPGVAVNCSNTIVRQIPEPASLALLGSALLGLGLALRRRAGV